MLKDLLLDSILNIQRICRQTLINMLCFHAHLVFEDKHEINH
jgi:hypothetical protein